MSHDDAIAGQIRNAHDRLGALRARGRLGQGGPLLDETFEELGTALEELSVAQEELRVQAEEVAAARGRAEDERRRYQDLFENAPDGYLVTDGEGVILEANRAAAALLIAAPRSLAGRPLVLYVDAPDRARFHAVLSSLLLGRGPGRLTARLRPRGDGDEGPVVTLAATAAAGQGGEPARFRWSLRDVTDQTRAEEQVRRLNAGLESRVNDRTAALVEAVRERDALLEQARAAERRLAFLLESGRALASTLDPEEVLTRLAERAVPALADWCLVETIDEDGKWCRRAVALPPDQCERLRAWEADHPTDALSAADLPERPVYVSDASAGEPTLFAALGWRSAAWLPLADEGGPFGALALGAMQPHRLDDPADRAMAEEFARRVAQTLRNAELHRRAREADRRKDEFLALLGHELRNPLAPIRNALHLLGQPVLGAEAAAWARDMLDRQLRRLTLLIDDLLDVSRISRGKVLLRPERGDLAAAAARAAEAAGPAAEARGLTLAVEPAAGPVWVDADPGRLDQVLSNLLANAVKYTEPGGSVTVAARAEPGWAVVRVRDTGVGIPAELLPKLFEPFVQGERSLDRSEGGLGVGLALARRLVELHGGTVAARSDGPGRGSEFTVRLPAAGPAAAEVRPHGPREAAPAAVARSVLVVDDNRDAAESLAVLLRACGHRVTTAADGAAALRAADESPPEVAVLDIGLPGMSGHELASHLRGRPWGRGILLVALTGYGLDSDREMSRAAGFDAHLVKPVDPDFLCDLIARR